MKSDDKGPYIELCDFLKVKGISSSGGQAKMLIRSGEVFVNGESDTRVKKKLRDGDVVDADGRDLIVKKEELF